MGFRINGNMYSWSSIEVGIAGFPVEGISAIDYDDGLDPGLPRGTSSVPLGSTQGPWSGSATLTMFRRFFDTLVLALGGPGFGTVETIVNVMYFEEIEGVKCDTLLVKFSKNSVSNSDSSDGTSIKCDLTVLQPILWNGIPRVVSA
jgi:hypothetical protein